jgi:hypothetical protein
MRIPENPSSAMALFWYLVYALALFSVVVARILARNQDSRMALARESIRGSCGFRN